ncbi:glycosyl hydrolase family 18 protein [Paenibacillus thermoaerophilus]|uniref:Glycosyl hydrolase family 18 protein n=1 Tax=Paenibacillus thermoaerophilus TaxID=1215385 RepID=A0ABW2V3X8_9BACL|nr:glycosyl hydrolase family 18 protein [Paenibacillus thermoaerophilus]TMV17096.1 glycoside hydrolase family 18 [Paenibacillus thermoaerophilus]
MKNRRIKQIAAAVLAAGLIGVPLDALAPWTHAPATAQAATADQTTRYRVYQYNKALKEFSDANAAISYAKWFSNSYVERIGTREWIWNNVPRYRVYQYDVTLPDWQFATLDAAIAEARKWSHASVRDLQGSGWVWDNYPRRTYRVYQGDITLDQWEFKTLDAAIAEARKWAGSHIIDNSTNGWVWDNVTESDKAADRARGNTYQVSQGSYAPAEWRFGYLGDAVEEALKWANSVVVDTRTGKTVYANPRPYVVFQNGVELKSFISLDEAIGYAKLWANATIEMNGRPIWTNEPSFSVYQGDNKIGAFRTIPEALAYAKLYSNSSIRTPVGAVLWDNWRKLKVWGWNGSSAAQTIRSHVTGTMGLDADSPTWFQLADASGALKDDSSAETVKWLRDQGYQVHPLVHNQFDKAMTTQFLADPAAQDRFISALVKRAAELRVDGLNLDFENIAGSDRANFTEFVRKLSAAMHEHNLHLSIDLPRGSLKWNHLTAFDHAKLKDYADTIIIMAYDQHYSSSPTAGSVSGLAWAEEGIQEFLSYGIPRDKLMLGIPFYVREWKKDAAGNLVSNRALLMKDLPALIAAKNAVSTWDPQYGQYRIEYSEGGYNYVFWLEDKTTVEKRLELAKKYELAGVAAWRLGYDNKDLWELIVQEK